MPERADVSEVERLARGICASRGQDPDEVVFADATTWDRDGDRQERPAKKRQRWETYAPAARALARLHETEE